MYFRRLHWALAIVALTAIAVSGQVQKSTPVWTEWETITPDGEEFTVHMPKTRPQRQPSFLSQDGAQHTIIRFEIIVRTGARDRFDERHQVEPGSLLRLFAF